MLQGKGLEVLTPQKAFSELLSGNLLDFVGTSYQEALQLFEVVKSTLSGYKTEGSDFLLNKLTSFTGTETAAIRQQIENLVPLDMLTRYEEEIEKAQTVLEFLDYIRDNGLAYSATIRSDLAAH